MLPENYKLPPTKQNRQYSVEDPDRYEGFGSRLPKNSRRLEQLVWLLKVPWTNMQVYGKIIIVLIILVVLVTS